MGMTVQEVRELLRHADEREFAALERSLAADTRKGVRTAVEVARRRLDSQRAERQRVESLYAFEKGFLKQGQSIIVGLDEVGRGAVAGPLAVCAVILPDAPTVDGLNDSKKLTPEQRTIVADEIRQIAVAWAVEYVSARDIDQDGMSASLRRAFKGALSQVEQMGLRPDVVLVDGNPLHIDDREVNVVKGDAKCASIAAASIVAKVSRDTLMCELSEDYPEYLFGENKGYGSPQHIEAIRAFGPSPLHRRSFCMSFLQESLF